MFKQAMVPVMMIFSAMITSQVKGDWPSFPVCEAVSEQSEPDVSGDTVVWADKRMGGYDIYSYDLAEPNEYPIDTAGGDQTQPVISGAIIVWTDNNNIIGYDLSGAGKFTICADGADQDYPAIDGNIVVWRDKRNFSGNSYDIYGCDISDISDPNEFAICKESHGQYYPDVSDNTVVWIDVRNSSSQPDIYGYNLSTKQPLEICTNASGQYNPKISGDVVVWTDDRSGHNEIYGYRLSTETEFPICTHHSASVSNPAISGNLVVWQDKRNGNDNSDIYGYDIENGVEFPVCTAAGGQINPATDGLSVVWQQGTGSSANLYGAYRPVPSEITLVSPDGGEMLPAGSVTDIAWQDSGPEIENVRLDYSIDTGGNWNLITSSTANTGSFEWNPVPAANSEQCLVRISDVGDSGASDISDDVFTIFECSESLTADLNGDCFVDIKDFSLFCQQWLQGGNPYDPAWPNR